MKELRIYNGFGITPTNTHQSAGMDFYVPNVKGINGEVVSRALYGLKKSYGIDDLFILSFFKEINEHFDDDVCQNNALNMLHLYCAYSTQIFDLLKKGNPKVAVDYFVKNYLVFDDNGIPGVKMNTNSSLFINSGIKVALEPGTAGIFLNKSGKGQAGFDVRAQVVDEDYAGYVHLNVAYTKDCDIKNVVYCGDKLTQMVILPVIHMEPKEISEDDYDNIMKDSARGADGFGSSDVKH